MTIFQCIFGIFHWLCGATTGTTHVNSAGGDKLGDGTSPWWTTWTAHGTDECWPQKWVPEDLREKEIENVRVLSLSYDSIASRWGRRGRTRNVSDIGKDLVQKLICNSDWKLYEHQRIVLVGHSFGGLVIKSMIVEAQKRLMKRGMVPGTSTTAKGVVSLRLAGIVDNLKPFQMEMEELSDDFRRAIRQNPPIPIYAIVETQKYMQVIVVERASATHLANEWMMVVAHFALLLLALHLGCCCSLHTLHYCCLLWVAIVGLVLLLVTPCFALLLFV
ncbi:unnamed protein product [Sphagnum balticum]